MLVQLESAHVRPGCKPVGVVNCELQACHRESGLLPVGNHRQRFMGQLGGSLSHLSPHECPTMGEKAWTHRWPQQAPSCPGHAHGSCLSCGPHPSMTHIIQCVMVDST